MIRAMHAGWTAAAAPCCKQLRLGQPKHFVTCLELSASTMTAAAEDTDTSRRSVMSSGLPCRNTKLLPWRWSGGICRLPHTKHQSSDGCERHGFIDAALLAEVLCPADPGQGNRHPLQLRCRRTQAKRRPACKC